MTLKCEASVTLTFALRYLQFFTKASILAPHVILRMSPDVPLLTEYKMGDLGHLRFFLAPKLDD